ncbi:putative alpha-E superfamily protein [Marmoricola sp. OAE513]|uniref:alpha-E domain-containing protein n=1 Tax=Marmoricola sp. OAE513 TaxID=2817894 RepID=UPI001AE67981
MLSRIAESLFWIGRYIERAEDTARILEVQTQLMVDDPTLDIPTACSEVLAIMGVPEVAGTTVGTHELLQRLAYDPASPASIHATMSNAREVARRARETLSTSMWEAVNTTWRMIPSGRFESMGPSGSFRWMRDRAALINGTADATMPRDEGWQFLMLGRWIERADMTARLVSAASVSTSSAWATSLHASGGYESFLRTYNGLETDRKAAEFLVLDRLFPRSVVFALSRAEVCLENLESAGQRAGFQNEAQRLLGRTRAELEYRALADVLTDLPHEMERLQRTCAQATEAVTRRYFAGSVATIWNQGRW